LQERNCLVWRHWDEKEEIETKEEPKEWLGLVVTLGLIIVIAIILIFRYRKKKR
jgi:hypothetical protein